ncbi:UNVERIFIED_CONTAM: hypothetical protein GTU68_046339 [Idotea baltica]|nr:hypothetical protein [Idotea baltica]
MAQCTHSNHSKPFLLAQPSIRMSACCSSTTVFISSKKNKRQTASISRIFLKPIVLSKCTMLKNCLLSANRLKRVV